MTRLSSWRLGLLVPLFLAASQFALLSHDLEASHTLDVDCELCLVLERADDELLAVQQPHHTGPAGAAQRVMQAAALPASRTPVSFQPRGPPTP